MPPDVETLNASVRIATLGNLPQALGLSALPTTEADIDADVVLVARDMAGVVDPVRGTRLEASEWYVVPVHVVGHTPIAGLSPELLLADTFPRIDSLVSQCGTVTMPGASLACGTPQCLPAPLAQFASPLIAKERWVAGRSRVTLRKPDDFLSGALITYACNEFPAAPASSSARAARGTRR
jgi:hypothetical protein